MTLSLRTSIDEFSEYPTPQRATNWTLPNSSKRSGSTRQSPLRETNATRDIEGACSGTTAIFHARRFQHKPNLFTTQDVPGATSPVLHPTRRKPMDVSLRTDDIPRCTPGLVHLQTNRVVDPLKPQYHLPQISERVLKQVDALDASLHISPSRDPMKISDISGTRAKAAYERRVPRNPLDYSDVPKHSHEPRSKRQTSTSLVTQDIVGGSANDLHVPFPRHISPLDPQYVIPMGGSDHAHATTVIGEVPGSKSASPKPMRKDRPMLSLRSDDVEGARPGDPYKKKSYI